MLEKRIPVTLYVALLGIVAIVSSEFILQIASAPHEIAAWVGF